MAGALVAAFISHRRGIYYAFMTIAFGQIFWFIAVKSHAITGGEDGLLKIVASAPANFGLIAFDRSRPATFRAVLLHSRRVFAIVAGLPVAAGDSLAVSDGCCPPIRQSEVARGASWAINVRLYKILGASILSAALSGLAGGLFAMAQNSAFPDVMSLHYSGYVVMMTLVGGGMVSFWGPVIGAALFLLARDVIGALTTAWMLWFGLLFMLVVLFKPEGIAGWWQAWRARATGRRPGVARWRALFGG